MKSSSIIIITALSSSLLPSTVAIGHNGYVLDTSHSYDHKKDLEKLKHPNQIQDIHVVDIEGRQQDQGEDDEHLQQPLSRKALLMGVRSPATAAAGYYNVNNNAVALDNIVTNILEASAAVEREDVFSMSKNKK